MATPVTGGAGYVGSHGVRALVARGERVARLPDVLSIPEHRATLPIDPRDAVVRDAWRFHSRRRIRLSETA